MSKDPQQDVIAEYENLVAQVDGPEFKDDFDWDYVSPDGLSVKDAWAIASTWRSELLDTVTITTSDVRNDFAAFDNYEWIQICLRHDGPCNQVHIAKVARAASLVWRALGAIPGFRPCDNPVFWKRLFEALAGSEYTLRDYPVNDMARFFVDISFPRFRIQLSEGEHGIDSLLAFCGLDGRAVGPTNDAVACQMKRNLDFLAPFLARRSVDLSKAIDVEIVLPSGCSPEWMMQVNNAIDRITKHREATIASVNASTNAIITVDCSGVWRSLDAADAIKGFLQSGVRADTAISSQHVRREIQMSPHDRAILREYVVWAVGLDPQAPGGLQTVLLSHDDTIEIAEFCSALPQARTLETIRLKTPNKVQTMNKINAAWLGYALFHPDSEASTWRQLELSNVGFETPIRPTLEMMAKGNNLHIALGLADDDAVSDVYFQATIQAGALIHTTPDDSGSIVEKVQAPSKFDVCVRSTDLDLLDDWVLIIAPGLGHAWIRSIYIMAIAARSPSGPFLRGLKVSYSSEETEQMNFVRIVGARLEYLDLCYKWSDDLLHDLRTVCPQLHSFEVGLVIDDEITDAIQLPPSVRDLRIHCVTSLPSFKFSSFPFREISSLRSFQMNAFRFPGVQLLSQAEVVEFIIPLLRGNQQLEYFDWQWYEDPVAPKSLQIDPNLSYAQRRFLTRRILRALEPERDDTIKTTSCAGASTIALMSVVLGHGQVGTSASAVSQLDAHVVQYITAFITPRIECEFAIEL